VQSDVVPAHTWKDLFTAQGAKNPEPRIQMLNGFNEGWIEFEGGQAGSRKGPTNLEAALKAIVQRLN
jgi:hypothetical protein